ncbi:MAG: hypothetical protein ACR2IS_06150 [Nitrososphaeraceae archaeon]
MSFMLNGLSRLSSEFLLKLLVLFAVVSKEEGEGEREGDNDLLLIISFM